MAKAILFFLMFWAVVTGSIHLLRKRSLKQNWTLTKNVMYGFFTSIVTFLLIAIIVILF